MTEPPRCPAHWWFLCKQSKSLLSLVPQILHRDYAKLELCLHHFLWGSYTRAARIFFQNSLCYCTLWAEMSVITSTMKAGECFFALLSIWEMGRDSQGMVKFIPVHHTGLEISAPQMMGALLRCLVSSYVNFYGICYRLCPGLSFLSL